MQSLGKRRLIIAALLAGVVLVGILLFTYSQNSRTSYIDKPSGETVSNPRDRDPEAYGEKANSITFYGTAKLIESGVSDFAVTAFRDEMQSYSNKNNNSIKTVSVYVDTISFSEDDTTSTRSFKIQINRKDDMNIQLISEGILDVKIVGTDKDGKKVIQTGKIEYQPDDSDENEDTLLPPGEE